MDLSTLWESDYRPELVSGKLCLDFANSLEPRGGPPPYALPPDFQVRDCLGSYANLIAWGVYAGALNENVGRQLARIAAAQPEQAATIFARALAFRDVIYRVFWMIATGKQPADDDLKLIAEEHHTAVAQRILVQKDDSFEWQFPETTLRLDRMLWPIALSATELLIEAERARIKICPGVAGDLVPCAWLFYDTSKSRTRHWCSMGDCGGTTKMRRQNERRRQRSTTKE